MKSWDVWAGAGLKFQDSPVYVLTMHRQKHETLDLEWVWGAETINGRLNDRLITTPTKPAEHNPRGGRRRPIICHCLLVLYATLTITQISNFISRVPVSSVLNIASVNNWRIRGRTYATGYPNWHCKEGGCAFRVNPPYRQTPYWGVGPEV